MFEDLEVANKEYENLKAKYDELVIVFPIDLMFAAVTDPILSLNSWLAALERALTKVTLSIAIYITS